MAFKWVAPFTFTAATAPTAATWNQLRDNLEALNGYVLKSADESVTSSTVMQDDNALTYTIPQAGTYVADWWLSVVAASDTNGDIQIQFTFPTGTLYVQEIGHTPAIATGALADVKLFSESDASSPSSARPFGLTATQTLILVRTVLVATASGTLTLQWAQDSSSANATTVKAGSNMTIRQVA